MFCCAAELGMMVFGIVTLVKGKFALSKSHVVTGPPAYVIGALLTATIPILFMIGFVVGLSAAARGQQPDPTEYAWIDLTIVPVILERC